MTLALRHDAATIAALLSPCRNVTGEGTARRIAELACGLAVLRGGQLELAAVLESLRGEAAAQHAAIPQMTGALESGPTAAQLASDQSGLVRLYQVVTNTQLQTGLVTLYQVVAKLGASMTSLGHAMDEANDRIAEAVTWWQATLDGLDQTLAELNQLYSAAMEVSTESARPGGSVQADDAAVSALAVADQVSQSLLEEVLLPAADLILTDLEAAESVQGTYVRALTLDASLLSGDLLAVEQAYAGWVHAQAEWAATVAAWESYTKEGVLDEIGKGLADAGNAILAAPGKLLDHTLRGASSGLLSLAVPAAVGLGLLVVADRAGAFEAIGRLRHHLRR